MATAAIDDRDGGAPADEEDATPAAKPGPLEQLMAEAGEYMVFSARALRQLPGTFTYFSEVCHQAALIVKRSSFLLLIMNAFLGFSVATFGFFFLRSIGAGDYVGIFTGLLTQRQVSMTMFGYVLSSSICCGITAELGAAKIGDEVSAYESTGVDTMKILVGTRVLAVMMFVPLACVISLLGQLLGNYLDVVILLKGNSGPQFLTTTFSVQSIPGQINTLITFAFMALPCALVACFYGLRTQGGPASVGQSVARSLMLNLVLVHVISAFFGVFFYGRHLGIPISGAA